MIEHEDAMWQWAATRILETAGYEVACCSGPYRLPYGQCPLVAGDRCSLVDSADLVVNGLDVREPANRSALTALRTRLGHVPVIVEIPTQRVAELHAEIPGCRTIPLSVGPEDFVAAVDDALDGQR